MTAYNSLEHNWGCDEHVLSLKPFGGSRCWSQLRLSSLVPEEPWLSGLLECSFMSH